MSRRGTHRPLIAVTASERGNRAAWLATRWLIRRSGGRAVRVRPSRLSDSFGPVDGVVLLGGVDVDPARYGGERDPQRWIEPARDRRELELIDAALSGGRPLLCICRGAQLLNVALGGTLRRLERRRVRTVLPHRRAWIAPGTALRRLAGRPLAWINTMHDYAIDRLGAGLIASAVDSAGVVQAIERRGEPLAIGVQWHPELLLCAPTTRRLFRALLGAAREPLRPGRPGS